MTYIITRIKIKIPILVYILKRGEYTNHRKLYIHMCITKNKILNKYFTECL